MTSLKLACKKLGTGIVLLQWLGNLGLMLLAFAWLQIPDSHMWQFLFSLLSAAILVLAFLALHARTFQKLCGVPTESPWWLRLLIMFAMVLLGYFLLQLIGIGRSHEMLFAGYWNSKFPAGQRSFFTFQRLVAWQDHFYDLLQWLLVALLLPVAFVGAVSGLRGGTLSVRSIYRHLLYWLVVVIFCFIGSYLTSLLVGWTPGHGTTVEILSVLLRLVVAYTLDVVLWCFVLGLMAVYAVNAALAEPEQ